MKGACAKHKGIDSSKDVALSALSAATQEKAPTVFKSLTKILKTCLIGIIENQHDNQIRRTYESMVNDFIVESDALLASWKQCIFYLSEAYIEVFYGAHKVTSASNHSCCHRYFPDEQFRAQFEEEKAISESMQENSDDDKGAAYCTCTVIDLLFQAD